MAALSGVHQGLSRVAGFRFCPRDMAAITMTDPVLKTPCSHDALASGLADVLSRQGYLFVPAADIRQAWQAWCADDSDSFARSWETLAPDRFMGDDGRYRRRRHGVFSARAGASSLSREPHRPHFQTMHFNQLNGGIERYFEPVLEESVATRTFAFVSTLALATFSRLRPQADWHVEMHQFRIEVGGEITAGLPTPEGLHRDGVSFVLMMMITRDNVREGVSHIHDLDRERLAEFTLTERFDLALVDDERVLHGVTPIVAADASRGGVRDLLVLTFRDQPLKDQSREAPSRVVSSSGA